MTIEVETINMLSMSSTLWPVALWLSRSTVRLLAFALTTGVIAIGILMMIVGAFLAFPSVIFGVLWFLWPGALESIGVAVGTLVGAIALELAGFGLILLGPRLADRLSRRVTAASTAR